jgi:hypothetical protein
MMPALLEAVASNRVALPESPMMSPSFAGVVIVRLTGWGEPPFGCVAGKARLTAQSTPPTVKCARKVSSSVRGVIVLP